MAQRNQFKGGLLAPSRAADACHKRTAHGFAVVILFMMPVPGQHCWQRKRPNCDGFGNCQSSRI